MTGKRIDKASRRMRASPTAVYQALVDPRALEKWLPPQGMRARIDAFDPRPGGAYDVTLTYDDPNQTAGKSTETSDTVRGKFVELAPDERVVQAVEFRSDDAAFAGTMRITWSLAAAAEGTEVTVACEDVPSGITPEDHEAGLASSLDNLAAFVEAG